MNALFNNRLFIILSCLIIGTGIGIISTRAFYERELDGRDRLIERYGNDFNSAAETNHRLAERNERLERGLAEIGSASTKSVTNIRTAIEIISAVRDILKEMEASGALGNSRGAGGGTAGGFTGSVKYNVDNQTKNRRRITMSMPKNLEGKAVSIMNQPNRGKGAGRKPKLVKSWIKEINVSKQDAQNMLKQVLFNNTLANLEALSESESDKVSSATLVLIRAAVGAAKKADFSVMKQMLEFLYGKDEQQVSVQDDKRVIDLKNLLLEQAGKSAEEREKIIGELETHTGNAE
jgi:hypothetical protein